MRISKRTVALLAVFSITGTVISLLILWTCSRQPLRRITEHWDRGSLAGWQSYGGVWSARDGFLRDTLGARGDKILFGSERWTNYTVESEMRFDSDPAGLHWGDAGLLLRVTDPEIGVDSYNGYYVGVSYADRLLFIGKATYAWNRLAWTPVPALQKGRWYKLRASAKGCFVSAELATEEGALNQVSFYDADCRIERGSPGLRTFDLQTSWRNVTVSP